MMQKNPVEILKNIDILTELSEDELSALQLKMKKKEYPSGKELFHEGDVGDTMYIILAGSVAITVETPDGETLELAEIAEGSFFGEMCIFDSSPRSATCITKQITSVLSLKGKDFYEYIKVYPGAGIRIMYRMLNTATGRLKNTGAFLSDMVTWGEQARTRAITDDFTGLYNRRYLDQALETQFREAHDKKSPLTLVMIDLDHFGTLNSIYGQEVGDQLILEATDIFRRIFRPKDILARYGGDEFTFLLPDTPGLRGLNLCRKMVQEFRKIETLKNLEGDMDQITVSVGLVDFPDNADSIEELREKADQALYKTKEAGRNGATLWNEPDRIYTKHAMFSIAQRSLVIQSILDLIAEKDNFLVVGHRQPDEDCISSMISMALLIKNFQKNVTLLIPRKLNSKFQYMVNISKYNSIDIAYNDETLSKNISVVFVLDTPKPEMRESFNGADELLADPAIPVIEVDHHLEADSGYIGDPGLCLVDEMASASELVGVIAYKLSKRNDLIRQFHIKEIFSRNFVLAVLTGIVGDTKMGKFLKTDKERWYYKLCSTMFNEMLQKKTRRDSRNFSTMEEVFFELQKLSDEEDECYKAMLKYQMDVSSNIGSVVISKKAMDECSCCYDHETIITVARFMADHLAEQSGYLSLVAYHDDRKDSDLIQFRIRRNQQFKSLDLRDILVDFAIENGGGHPGAIGFRIPEKEVGDIKEYSKVLIGKLEEKLPKKN